MEFVGLPRSAWMRDELGLKIYQEQVTPWPVDTQVTHIKLETVHNIKRRDGMIQFSSN